MSYKITLRTSSYNTFIVSIKAANRIEAKSEVINIYPDCSIVSIQPGRIISW